DEARAALEKSRSETRKIADHAAAEGDDEIVALGARRDEIAQYSVKLLEGFRVLARRDEDGDEGEPRRLKPFGQARQMERGYRFIRHHEDARAPGQRLYEFACPLQQALADQDVVAAVSQLDTDLRFD